MAKLNTPKGKLVRKLGVNIFGNPKFDRLLSKKRVWSWSAWKIW